MSRQFRQDEGGGSSVSAADFQGSGEAEEASAEKNEPVITAEAHYSFTDTASNTKIEESDSILTLVLQLVSIEPVSGERHEFGYREILEMRPADYIIDLVLDGFTFSFSDLGEKYYDLVRLLYKLRNDQFAHDMLVDEGKPILSVRGKIETVEEDGRRMTAEGELRVYETRLGVFPDSGEMKILRFSEVTSFKIENYGASFNSDGLKITVTQLGDNFNYFVSTFQSANSELPQGDYDADSRDLRDYLLHKHVQVCLG